MLHKWENPGKQCFVSIHGGREGMQNVYSYMYDQNRCYLNSVCVSVKP